jgi:hypothetical protein
MPEPAPALGGKRRDKTRPAAFDRRQPIGEYSRKDCDHLAIAVIGTGKFSPHALHA